MAMFTLNRIVKRSVAESVPDRASVHTRNAAFEAVSAPEQYCSAPLLKVERSVSDRFLRLSESSLNTKNIIIFTLSFVKNSYKEVSSSFFLNWSIFCHDTFLEKNDTLRSRYVLSWEGWQRFSKNI